MTSPSCRQKNVMNNKKNTFDTWGKFFSINMDTNAAFESFSLRNKKISTTVFRAQSESAALEIISNELSKRSVKSVALSEINILEPKKLEEALQKTGIICSHETDLNFIEKSDAGISQFDMGIAETGSIVQDASSLQDRLVSMLPPIHIALLSTKSIAATLEEAFLAISKANDGVIPDYVAVITGASRTGDIENTLTIGVHGPGELIIICIDKFI